MPATPRRLSDTTPIPETAPPLKDVIKASLRLLLAAAAVRMFDLTLTYMPMYPDNAEAPAPTKNDRPTQGLGSIKAAMSMASTTLIAMIVVYCLFM